jgi:hypothetical protein
MSDTHALFEELVRDKPALRLDVAAIERRAERRILTRRALAGVVVLGAAGSVAVGVSGQHASRRDPADMPAPAGLAFTSAEQIAAADARVVQVMLATAGAGAKLTQSTPAVITAATRQTIHRVSYQKDGASVSLFEYVNAPSGNAELATTDVTGKDQNSPCATAHHAPTTQADDSAVTYSTSILCVGQPLPDGAMLWTFVAHWGASAPDSPPNAFIEEPDGSTVFVQTSAVKAGRDAAGTMTRDQVGAFAIALEKAWQQG